MSSAYFRKVHHTIKCAHTREYISATANGDLDRPQLAVVQYIPLDNEKPQPGDVTFIATHANGFPKELYEPLWDEIHKRSAQQKFRIRGIWIANVWNQGQSGVLNESVLGNDPSWWDHARDLLNLINQKQDEMPHPLVGIGHSFGATQLTMLSLLHPRLLTSLVLMDPVMQLPNAGVRPAIPSTHRRDIWPSRSEASAKFHGNKFYQAWDPRVLELWIEHGLRDLPTSLFPKTGDKDERVTLTTSKHQELFTFLRPTYNHVSKAEVGSLRDKDPILDEEFGKDWPFYRSEPLAVFKRLPEVRPSVLYIFGGTSDLSTPELRKAKMEITGAGVGGSGGAKEGRVQEIVLEGTGHLVAMERVGDCADGISTFLGRELDRWREERRDFEEKWVRGVKGLDKVTIGDRWKSEITPVSMRKEKKAKAKI
ncbi:Alpha/beta hydrolase family domain containing protein [Rhypophila decipiens]